MTDMPTPFSFDRCDRCGGGVSCANTSPPPRTDHVLGRATAMREAEESRIPSPAQ